MSVINPNLPGPNSARALDRTPEALGRSLGRLSAGTNPAQPVSDKVDVAAAEKFEGPKARIQAATAKVQDAISSLQTSDSFMAGISKTLSRMGELGQLAKDAKTPEDTARYQQEFSSLQEQLRQTIGGTTEQIGGTQDVAPQGTFNGAALFGKSAAASSDAASASHQVDLTDGAMGAIIQQDDSGSFVLNLQSATITDDVARAATDVQAERSSVNAAQSRLGLVASALAVENENLNAAISRIGSGDAADESTRLAKQRIFSNANAALQAQANFTPQSALKVLED